MRNQVHNIPVHLMLNLHDWEPHKLWTVPKNKIAEIPEDVTATTHRSLPLEWTVILNVACWHNPESALRVRQSCVSYAVITIAIRLP